MCSPFGEAPCPFQQHWWWWCCWCGSWSSKNILKITLRTRTGHDLLSKCLVYPWWPCFTLLIRCHCISIPPQALFTQPEVFESLGFTTLTEPCLVNDFFVDSTAEIMGTQVSNNYIFLSSCMRGESLHDLGTSSRIYVYSWCAVATYDSEYAD